MPEIRIENSLELLSQEEWDKYLEAPIFNKMIIDIEMFSTYKDRFFMYPRLEEAINGHNNKIGDLRISYALCKHYYDKDIPDNPWYISPGKNGQSIQYLPDFEDEHWMRLYWFNHFSENLYLKYFSVWDGIIEILNIFYGINEQIQDYRFRMNVMKRLKDTEKKVYDFLDDILKNEIYKEANQYRTDFVHGFAPSTVTNCFRLEENKIMEFPEYKDGKVDYVKKKYTRLSCTAGEYTLTTKVMNNAENFASFSGDKITELIELINA